MSVPILLYHRVADEVVSPFCVPRSRFARQVSWLRNRGFSSVTVRQLAESWVRPGGLPPRPVVIAFDDGYADTYDQAAAILAAAGMTASLFVVTDMIGTARPFPWDRSVPSGSPLAWGLVRELAAAGWEVGSHGATHADLSRLPVARARAEIAGSRTALAERLGAEVASFSYPFGAWTAGVRGLVAEAGYRAAICITGSLRDPLCLFARMILARDGRAAFGLKTTAAYGWARTAPLVRRVAALGPATGRPPEPPA